MRKVVVITGGTDGLGKETAKRLAANYLVVILGKDADKARHVAESIGCAYVVADVRERRSLERAAEEIRSRFLRIDRLVNNAGVWIQGRLIENNPEDIEEVLAVNTKGVIFSTQAFLPLMTAGSLIVNIISQAGIAAKADRTVYNASKWAITGFTKSLELELAPLKIRVAGFYPGAFQTRLFEKAGNPRDMSKALKVETVAAALADIIEAPENVIISDTVIRSADY
jgi:NAD(P)-dependent dehydrogenase (short-subunit alcohol dehydrogenase family)